MRPAFDGFDDRASKLRRWRPGLIALAMLGAALGAGCAPMAAPIPFSTMQRGNALPQGASATAIGAGVGVGGVGWPEGAGGGAIQHRVATSATSELSVGGQMIAYQCSGCAPELQGTHVSFAGRVGGRWQLGPDTALLGGLGYAGGAGGEAVGMDAGLVQNIFSRGYLSLRAGTGEPTSRRDVFNEHDGVVSPRVQRTGYGVVAAGVRLGERSAFLAETGLALIETPAEDGAAAYVLLGVDLLRLGN